jgi:CRP-like cAMP-binding protein
MRKGLINKGFSKLLTSHFALRTSHLPFMKHVDFYGVFCIISIDLGNQIQAIGEAFVADDMSLLRSTLKRVDFFYSLNFAQLDELINALKQTTIKKGTEILKQGDMGDKFFIIASGEVSVHIKKGLGGTKKVAVLGDGDFFGEMALISDLPRTATVIAEKTSEMFVMYKRDFRKILMANPKINQLIQGTIVKRKNA